MIGNVIRTTDNGRIKRAEDKRYIDAMFAYTSKLRGHDGCESRHRTHRPYVVAYPETKMYIESAAFPSVTDQNDVVIAFRDRQVKQAFDRFRRQWERGERRPDVDAEASAGREVATVKTHIGERRAKRASRGQSNRPRESHQLGLFGDDHQP